MCWTTSQPKFAEKKVAPTDISVFKIVRFDDETDDGEPYSFIPYYRVTERLYELGKTYKMDESICLQKLSPDGTVDISEPNGHHVLFMIHKGFHSYNPEKLSLDYHQLDPRDWKVNVTGYDYNDQPSFIVDYCIIGRYNRYIYRLECIIPKGTTYYENEHGEMVSEAISIVSCKAL